jgi:hypothetical protein
MALWLKEQEKATTSLSPHGMAEPKQSMSASLAMMRRIGFA